MPLLYDDFTGSGAVGGSAIQVFAGTPGTLWTVATPTVNRSGAGAVFSSGSGNSRVFSADLASLNAYPDGGVAVRARLHRFAGGFQRVYLYLSSGSGYYEYSFTYTPAGGAFALSISAYRSDIDQELLYEAPYTISDAPHTLEMRIKTASSSQAFQVYLDDAVIYTGANDSVCPDAGTTISTSSELRIECGGISTGNTILSLAEVEALPAAPPPPPPPASAFWTDFVNSYEVL